MMTNKVHGRDIQIDREQTVAAREAERLPVVAAERDVGESPCTRLPSKDKDWF
jgi:hypothetical protein